jgi:hypothetical protein
MSAVLSRMFYRQNPAVQLSVTAAALLVVVAAHTSYLNLLSGNDIALMHVLSGSWVSLLLTIVISPLVFISLQGFWQMGGYKQI